MTKTLKNLRENIAAGQLARLKKEYEPMRKIDMSKHKGQVEKTTAQLKKLKIGTLIDLYKENIPWISDIAKSLVLKDKRFAHHVESVELDEKKIEYAYLGFRNSNEANRAARTAAELAGHNTQMSGQDVEIEVSSGGAGENLTIDGGKNDVSKIVKELVKLYRAKVLEKESLEQPFNQTENKKYLQTKPGSLEEAVLISRGLIK